MYNGAQLRYLARETADGLLRRKVSGTVAILIMGSALLMMALFSLVTINLDRVLQMLRGGIDVTVYLEDGLAEADRVRLYEDLLSTEGVIEVVYVSKERALDQLKAELGDEADLLNALDANPLPASFRLRLSQNLHTPEHVADLSHSLAAYPGVDEVEAQVEWVRRLDRITKLFMAISVIIGFLVLLSSLFVISNTVKLTIQESARSVEIMKLVGATNWFIRAPYVMGGALQGALAGLLAMTVLDVAYRFASAQVSGMFFFGHGQILGFVLLSTLLGAAGSTAALRRHLQL